MFESGDIHIGRLFFSAFFYTYIAWQSIPLPVRKLNVPYRNWWNHWILSFIRLWNCLIHSNYNLLASIQIKMIDLLTITIKKSNQWTIWNDDVSDFRYHSHFSKGSNSMLLFLDSTHISIVRWLSWCNAFSAIDILNKVKKKQSILCSVHWKQVAGREKKTMFKPNLICKSFSEFAKKSEIF